MKRGHDINIPLELTLGILKKLPTKSLVKFQCVSKQWSNIIGSCKDFIDFIITRSLTSTNHPYPHLILHHQSNDLRPSSCFIFSSTQLQNSNNGLVSIPGLTLENYSYIRGLILCWSNISLSVGIYNPTTRQSLILPKIQDDSIKHFFVFGYDSINNEYKVLCLITLLMLSLVFTLRDSKNQWRNIKCNIEHHSPCPHEVCINGVIYYRATKDHGTTFFLVGFDVMSEKFTHVESPKELIDSKDSTLINYQGKLGFVSYEINVNIWVMDDDKKQEWSKVIDNSHIGSGEIVYVNKIIIGPDMVYVVYFDPKPRACMQLVGINGISEEVRESNNITHIIGVPNHVENTMCLY